MATDWYRTADWDADAQAEFERRLERARPDNQIQYVRIKGVCLNRAGLVEDARALWERVLELPDEDDVEHAAALEHLGESWMSEQPARAEYFFRRVIDEHPSMGGTSTMEYIALAELLTDKGDSASLVEADALLEHWVTEFDDPFPDDLFRYQRARLNLARARGDDDGVRDAARAALELADLDPQFSRHKDLGVVRTDDETLDMLRRAAADG